MADQPVPIAPNLQHVEVVLFDLGNVLYEINLERAKAAMAALLSTGHAAVAPGTPHYPLELIFEFEKGTLSPEALRGELRSRFGLQQSDNELDAVWHEILEAPFSGAEALVARVSQRYRTALLSNTNLLHIERLWPEMEGTFAHMEHLFLSYEMGLRKPDEAIYTQALQKLDIPPDKALFADDMAQNVDAARALGMQAIHVTDFRVLEEAFPEEAFRSA